MALPSSGVLSISMINTELGRAVHQSNSSLLALANLARTNSTPYINRAMPKISHWYGYQNAVGYPHGVYDGSNNPGENATCSAYSGYPGTLYSPSASFVAGITLYIDAAMTNLYNGSGLIHFHINTYQSFLIPISSLGVTGNSITICGAADTTPPTVPTNLTILDGGNYDFYLNWNDSYDAVGVAGYNVFDYGQLIATVTDSNYIIYSVCGGTHVYTISAFDAAGNYSTESISVSLYSDNPNTCQ